MTLKGNLEVLNLSDIFQSLSLNQHTGTLRVTDGKREKLIYFAQGEITLLSSDKKLKIGDMLVAAQKISQEDLEYGLSQQKKTKKRLGEILVDEGFVTEDDVGEVVRSQIEEEIYDLFLWKKADFEFLIDYCPDKLKNPAHQVTKLQFNTNSLIMEALRRLDEWELISKEIPTLKEVYKVINASPAALEDVDLPDRVKAEIKLIDAERTVEAIAEDTTLSEFELCKLLYELKTRKIISPLSPQELADRAEECFQKGKFRQSAALYERLAEVLPKNISIRWHLADSMKAFGDEVRALEQYEFIAKKLEGTRDRVELARCYNALLELAPDRRDVAEKLRALDKQQWKRTAARALVYMAVVTMVAGAIVLLGIRTDRLAEWVEKAKLTLGISGSEMADAARNEQAAKELEKHSEELAKQGKTKESFDLLMKILTNYSKTGPASLVALPMKLDTIPTGKEIWINGVFRNRTPNVFKYLPEHEDLTKTPLKVEVRDAGRVLWTDTLDPTAFHDLTIDLFKRPIWKEPTDGAVRGRPMIAGEGKDAILYFASYDGYIRGIRLEDRVPTVKLPLRDSDPFGEVTSEPALAGELLVVGTLDGRCLAFDPTKRLKVVDLRVSERPLLARPAIVDDGQTAVLAGDDGEITFVSLSRRSIAGRSTVYCSNRVTALAGFANMVFVASRDNWLRALNAATFAAVWPVEMGGDIVAEPAVGEKAVVAGDQTGQVICVDREKGTRRWRAEVEAPVTGVEATDADAIVSTSTGTVQALNMESGRVDWRVNVERGAGRPVVVGDDIFVASSNAPQGPIPPAQPGKPKPAAVPGYLHALDLKTGQERWTAQLPAAVRGVPVVRDGRLYVGCDDGYLYCFETK